MTRNLLTDLRSKWFAALLAALALVGLSCARARHPEPTVVLHLDGAGSTVLELTGDTWTWRTCGCDSWAVESGPLTRKGGKVSVLPSKFRSGYRWPGLGMFYSDDETSGVELTLDSDGTAHVAGSHSGRQFTQTWKPGRVCAVCGRSSRPDVMQLGPTNNRPCSSIDEDPCARWYGE